VILQLLHKAHSGAIQRSVLIVAKGDFSYWEGAALCLSKHMFRQRVSQPKMVGFSAIFMGDQAILAKSNAI
jgi:hypothetical protein